MSARVGGRCLGTQADLECKLEGNTRITNYLTASLK